MRAFPSSGELNFSVKDPQKVMDEIFNHYKEALSTDFSDGMSMFLVTGEQHSQVKHRAIS